MDRRNRDWGRHTLLQTFVSPGLRKGQCEKSSVFATEVPERCSSGVSDEGGVTGLLKLFREHRACLGVECRKGWGTSVPPPGCWAGSQAWSEVWQGEVEDNTG